MVLDSSLYHDPGLSLEVCQPMLRKGNTTATNYRVVLRSNGLNNQLWLSLNRQIETLTAKRFMQCPRAGPHVVRHIVQQPASRQPVYSTAALVLRCRKRPE